MDSLRAFVVTPPPAHLAAAGIPATAGPAPMPDALAGDVEQVVADEDARQVDLRWRAPELGVSMLS